MFGFGERRRRGNTAWFALGACAGAAAMWLLDPARGGARRSRVRQRVAASARRAREEARRQARGALRRAEGRRYELLHAREEVDDDVLVERVRAQIGKRVQHAHALHIEAEKGCVVLSGPIAREELHGLLDIVRKVRGVKSIRSRLELRGGATDHPSLQH